MARASLGSLVVSLGLDAAEYTRGLTKAEYAAKQFGDRLAGQFAAVGRTLGTFVGGVAITAFVKDVISSAAALDDLAESTGVAVEELSRFDRVAKLTGAGSIEEVGAALERLTRSMQGAEDETKGAGAAFAAIGVQTRDAAGNLRSAGQVMEEVAKALAKYEDGANKTAIAQALFGRSGAQLLPFLKELAENSEIVGRVTTEQAAAAEKLEKEWRKLADAGGALSTVVLTGIVPGMNNFLEQLTTGIQLAGGFWSALAKLATLNPSKHWGLESDPVRRGLMQLIERQKIEANVAKMGFTGDVRDILAQRKPQAPALPGAGAGAAGRARALAEQTSEAQRYLEALEKQVERTQELTHTEQFLRDVQMDRIKGLKPELFDLILKQTQLLDSNEALAKAEKDRAKAAEEAARAEERINQATNNAIKSAMQETEAIRQGNDQLREQLEFLRGGEEAVNRLTDAKRASTIADLEAYLAALKHLEADQAWIKEIEDQIRLLKERQGLIGDMRLAEQINKEKAALQEVKNLFADALVDPLTDFVNGTKSAKDAFRDFANSVSQQLTRLASQRVANAIFGGTTSGGPDVFGWFAQMFGGMGGSSYGMNVRAMGGPVSANTPYLVGERGPELFLPKGAGTIVPNNDLKKGMTNNHLSIVVNVPSSTSRQSANQIATEVGIKVQRALARNT